MPKKSIILIILLFAAIAAMLYFFKLPSARKITQSDFKIKNAANIAKIETDYESGAKFIVREYDNLTKNDKYTIEQISRLKQKLLDLRVSAKFKELHIELVFALTKLENYLTDHDNNQKIASQDLINQAKIKYAWLNN